MTIAAAASKPAWRAELKWEYRYFTVEEETGEASEGEPENEPAVAFEKVWDCFVDVSRPGDQPIRFRVNRRKGRPVSVTDPREWPGGTASPGGLWGTQPWLDRSPPKPRVPRPHALSLVEFQRELAHLIGAEQAENSPHDPVGSFFGIAYDICKTMTRECSVQGWSLSPFQRNPPQVGRAFQPDFRGLSGWKTPTYFLARVV